jgi:hypothetical protein
VLVVAAIALIVAANLVARGLDDAVGGSRPSGAPGSSYATAEGGFAAYAQLLAEYGHPVQRQRGSLAEAALDPSAMLLISDADRSTPLDDAELATIRTFLQFGGRVVLVAAREQDVRAITGDAPREIDGALEYHEFDARLGDLRTVTTNGIRAYAHGAGFTVLASEGRRTLLVATPVEAGEVLLLAEDTPITNGAIGDADNAAFGLALPGTADRPVVFAEGLHGYGERRGLSALPARWKTAIALVGAAAVLFAWARARRLGPPDRPARDLPPARAQYVDALADTLARTTDRASALAALGETARDRIRRSAGLGPDASRDDLVAAARRLGFTDREIATLWSPPTADDDVLALGRVVARVTDERT